MNRLHAQDRELIVRCLIEALDSRYFPDGEFPILMGCTRSDLQEFVESDPALEDLASGSRSWKLVCSVLNNLTGYPHGRRAHLESQTGASVSELEALHDRVSLMGIPKALLEARAGDRLFVLNAAGAAVMPPPVEGSFFPCLVWDDSSAWSSERKLALARVLIRVGCRYAVCGGAASLDWEHAFDLAVVDEHLESSGVASDHVMTTSHDCEAPDEVAFFFVHNTSFGGHRFRQFVVVDLGDQCGGAAVQERVQNWLEAGGAV